jgi:hypothetical protein
VGVPTNVKGPARDGASRVCDLATKLVGLENINQSRATQAVGAHLREGKRPDRNAEARIQADVLEWLNAVAPELIVFHVPNGGYRSKAEAARLKWQGVLPGVPDLVLIGSAGRIWFLEIKTATGYLSPEQHAFADRCTAFGVPFAVIRGIDDARRAFAAWGIPTREAR